MRKYLAPIAALGISLSAVSCSNDKDERSFQDRVEERDNAVDLIVDDVYQRAQVLLSASEAPSSDETQEALDNIYNKIPKVVYEEVFARVDPLVQDLESERENELAGGLDEFDGSDAEM